MIWFPSSSTPPPGTSRASRNCWPHEAWRKSARLFLLEVTLWYTASNKFFICSLLSMTTSDSSDSAPFSCRKEGGTNKTERKERIQTNQWWLVACFCWHQHYEKMFVLFVPFKKMRPVKIRLRYKRSWSEVPEVVYYWNLDDFLKLGWSKMQNALNVTVIFVPHRRAFTE